MVLFSTFLSAIDHVTSGAGFPVTLHSSSTVSPSCGRMYSSKVVANLGGEAGVVFSALGAVIKQKIQRYKLTTSTYWI